MNSYPSKSSCGRRECTSSIHRTGGYLTFGRGQLDYDGHWEFPCRACAMAADERMPQAIEETKAILAKHGTPQDAIEAYIASTGWMHHPAWPFAEELQELAPSQLELELAPVS